MASKPQKKQESQSNTDLSIPDAKLKIEQWPIEKVINYARNARLHSDDQVKAIAASIKEFGFINPCLVDASGTLIAGHGRVMACKSLAIKTVPVIKLGHLSDDQIKALRIADNQLPMLANWSTELLRAELLELKASDYPIELIGFDDVQLVSFMTGFPNDSDRELAPAPPAVPTSKVGDVWLLGRHKIMCGDSTDSSVLEKLMGSERADLVFTDPPYRMEAEGGSMQPIGRAAARVGENIKHLTDFDPPAFLEALPTVFSPGVMNAFIFCNKDLLPDYLTWAVERGYAFNLLFWKKPMAIPLGNQHRPDVEYIVFLRKKGIWNNAVENANYSKCLEHGRESSTPHPTMKPVALIENELLIASRPNSIVVDFFSGSGSTLIACEIRARRCRAIDLAPAYVDVSVQRWQEFTKQQATLESDGRTFEEVARSRQKKLPAKPKGGAKPPRGATGRAKTKEAAE